PFPNAGVAELTLKDSREGARIRIRLDKPLDYELRQEPGLMSVTIVPWAPVRDLSAKVLWPTAAGRPEAASPAAPPPVEHEARPAAPPAVPREGQLGSAAGDVRDLYAKILPPPAGVGPEEAAPAEGGAAETVVQREGFQFGPVRLLPTFVTSYID